MTTFRNPVADELILEVRDLSVVRGSYVAIESASFAVHRGSFAAVAGPSGCGKSSLLRVLCLLDPPCEGGIKFLGEFVNQETDREILYPNIVYVPQTLALWPHMTLGENVLFAMSRSNKADSARELNDLCERLEVSEVLERTPKNASLGQCQRIALARALILKPKLLLLDEITSALDQKLSTIVWGLIAEYAKGGGTIIASTHDRRLVKDCDVVFEFSDAKLIERQTARHE